MLCIYARVKSTRIVWNEKKKKNHYIECNEEHGRASLLLRLSFALSEYIIRIVVVRDFYQGITDESQRPSALLPRPWLHLLLLLFLLLVLTLSLFVFFTSLSLYNQTFFERYCLSFAPILAAAALAKSAFD